MKKIEQSLLAEERVKLTEFPPSIVEPNRIGFEKIWAFKFFGKTGEKH